MDGVKKTFDVWANNGRAEKMEQEHAKSVVTRLETVSIPRRFLDVGCGNGWLVRRMAENKECHVVVGIDKSSNMIRNAKKRSLNKKEKYITTDIESWKYKGKFDFVFSMESLYYANSVDDALYAIYKLMAPGASLICGTDFYVENKATRWWSSEMKITMHLMSRSEWIKAFRRVGLVTSTRTIKDSHSAKKWRRQEGTLFVTGIKSNSTSLPKHK